MAISTNQKPTIYRNLYENTAPAYRAGYSCETALAKLMNDILWNIEHKKITLMCLLDQSAAFDTVDHSVLLEVLNKRYGMGGMVNDWLASYLSPRFCKISIQDAYSTPRELTFLGPTRLHCRTLSLYLLRKYSSGCHSIRHRYSCICR